MTATSALRATRVGIWTGALDGLPPAAVRKRVVELEELGYGSLWFAEAYGREALTCAQLLLSGTSRIVVASGIASIYARGAMATAAGARLPDEGDLRDQLRRVVAAPPSGAAR